MHKDFLTAIQNAEQPHDVYDRLCEMERKAHEKILKSYYRDLQVAERVLSALQEDPSSVMFSWAQSYRSEAEKLENQKAEEVRRSEKLRREIEADYLAEKKKAALEMRQHYHSDK